MEAARLFLVMTAVCCGHRDGIVHAADWDYEGNGPSTWPANFPTCNGSRQSPINFQDEDVTSNLYSPLVYRGHWDTTVQATLTNNGHSGEVTTPGWSSPASLTGGPLLGTYLFSNIHFHWGADSSEGSEHTLNQQRFSMEAHVVHYKKVYGNVTNASSYPDGLAVVGFFLEAKDSYSNPQLEQLAAAMEHVTTYKSSTYLPLTSATQWFHNSATEGGYLTYPGSLTTPTCNEAVTWIVYPTPVYIAESQVAVFRTLKSPSGSLLTRNYRPTQPLNNRKVRLAKTLSMNSVLNHVGEGIASILNHLGEGYVRV